MPAYAQNTLLLLNSSPTVWRAMEEFHYRLSKALVERGARVAIVLANPVPPEIERRLASSGASVHYLAYRRRWSFFWGLRKLIRENEIETVHIRFFNLHHLVPWIVRLHGVQNIVYTDAESNEPHARGLKLRLKRTRTRLLTAPVRRIIAISDFVRRRLIEGGVPAEKISVVYNGVDLTRFTPDEHGRERLNSLLWKRFGLPPLADGELVLCTISRLTPVKRVDVQLRACAILHERGVPLRLLIAGQGGPLERELKKLAVDLGIADRVHWLGTTDEPETLLRGSDVFLLASRGEAFGNVLIEAMACGVPVVASRSGSIPELVPEGEFGYLATPDSPDSFAEGIVNVTKGAKPYDPDYDNRQEPSSAATAHAAQFSVRRSVTGTLAAYEGLCP